MAQLTRKRAVLAKIETTYGTDPTPTGVANAILVKNLTITPLAANMVSRDLVRAYIGGFDQLVANQHVECAFEVEMVGSGSLGTAPAYGPLLRACGMSETITASTKVEYAPISTGFESITLYYNVDGVLHKITGARGSVQLAMATGQIPTFKFTFTGIYNAPTDTALPSTTLTGFKTPLAVNNTNTGAFSFFGVSTLVLSDFNLNVGNAIDFRNLVGAQYAQLTDRQSSGDLTIEGVPMATFNAFTTALGTSYGAISITHGTVSGYKVQIDVSNADIGNPTYEDQNGVNMLKVPFFAIPSSAGNDEFKITII